MSGLPLWMGTVPDFEVVNGYMQVTAAGFALAMPVNVFLVGCAKGKAAVVKWERERNAPATVIPFRQELSG